MEQKNKYSLSVRVVIKWTLRILASVSLLVIVLYAASAWYINTHKKEVLAEMTKQMGGQLDGTLTIGGMEPTFLTGFPDVSLDLRNVEIKDRRFNQHERVFLHANDIFAAVNTFAFFRGSIDIKKITVSNALVNLYTDANGYSNTSVFKKGSDSKEDEGGGIGTELRRLRLEEVLLNIENYQSKKEYCFKINDLQCNADFEGTGWKGSAALNVTAQRMTFSLKNGSFIKNKDVKGTLYAAYNKESGVVTVNPSQLEIGGEDFNVSAMLGFGQDSRFQIRLRNNNILWRHAAGLLSPNITEKLMMFNLANPIMVGCDIKGDFNAEGDPLIYVMAKVRNNTLDTPGGPVTNCNFDGVFTNNYVKEKGFTDANSAIKLNRFNGQYAGIPFKMNKAYILDLDNPIAVGDFHSDFDIRKVKSLIDPGLMAFSKGNVKADVTFRADIVNYLLSKPLVEGNIRIDSADVAYTPRKLAFKNVSVGLDFKKDDLYISTIHIQSGRSIIDMKGDVRNFLNLYYKSPERIVLNWQVNSPQLHLAEFLGFLGSRQHHKKAVNARKGNFTDELDLLFEKSNVNMQLRVQKLYYNKFLATNVNADLLLTEQGAFIKKAGLSHSGGKLAMTGTLSQKGNRSQFTLSTDISNVDISQFFKAFNNFDMQSLTSSNLSGNLFSSSRLSGIVTEKGTLLPSSMRGTVDFRLKEGKLIQFSAVKSVGKFAFPFRNLDTISFYGLKGQFQIEGEKVVVKPMQINSSLLNMDVDGIYSFGKGTKLYISVPLRNPEKDKEITDKEELAKRRNRGIVIHLVAEDGKDGKVKLGLGKKKE